MIHASQQQQHQSFGLTSSGTASLSKTTINKEQVITELIPPSQYLLDVY
jgi:hypothetical protein